MLSSLGQMERFVMSKKVLLVGHCGPDSSYLRMAVKRAVPEVDILMADDSDEGLLSGTRKKQLPGWYVDNIDGEPLWIEL